MKHKQFYSVTALLLLGLSLAVIMSFKGGGYEQSGF
jgi:hypothetical protein